MSRPGRTVYQITDEPRQVAVYASVLDASIACGIEYGNLYRRIACKLPYGDYYFTYDPDFIPPKIEKRPENKSIYFDIEAWAHLMRY